jgi:hypothetical protein
MTALATQADVETSIGRTLTATEIAKMDGALARASAVVRAATARKFEEGTYTVRRRVRNGRVSLDSPATVTGVGEVNDDGSVTGVTGYTLRGSVLYDLGCERWVEVTYTTTGAVPAELVEVVAAMAGRDLTSDRPQGATSYTITRGPFAESASFEDASDSVEPTSSEAKIIARYATRRAGAVSLL